MRRAPRGVRRCVSGRERQIAAAQPGETAEVVGASRCGRPGPGDRRRRRRRQGHAGGHERAFAEEDPVAEPGAGHEHRCVADLAEITTVAPSTRQRWPKTVRRPMLVGMAELPITTPFSSTADPVSIAIPPSCERTTAPSASRAPSPRRAAPITTAEPAMHRRARLRLEGRVGRSGAHGRDNDSLPICVPGSSSRVLRIPALQPAPFGSRFNEYSVARFGQRHQRDGVGSTEDRWTDDSGQRGVDAVGIFGRRGDTRERRCPCSS